MIEKIAVKNFKSLKDIDLLLTNLNVLAGLNGSGKSSFIQSLLLLRQSWKSTTGNVEGLVLQDGDLISLGIGKDVFYQYAGKEEKIAFEIQANKNLYKWSFDYHPMKEILPENQTHYRTQLSDFALFNRHFQYLNAEHIPPQMRYGKSENQVVNNRNIGMKGEFTAHYLSRYGFSEKVQAKGLQHPGANSDSLIHQTDAWINEISPGAKLIAQEDRGIDVVRLAIKFETKDGYTNEIKPINTGFGISYVLPVVVAILKAGQGDILILENPESHLHPRGQSTIGQLMAYAAQAGVNLFIETHSDHIINGIRVAVKDKRLAAGNVKIFYFDRVLDQSDQYTRVEEILIDKNGELSSYPRTFLDEWNEQLMKLI
jgi:predicted ATPase